MPVKQQLLQRIDAIKTDLGRAFVIHYACFAFQHTRAKLRPSRIVCIVVRNVQSNAVKCFSIHTIAKRENLSSRSKIKKRLDEFEGSVLEEFVDFMKANSDATFLHWNMRDSIFGFDALFERYEALTGIKPTFNLDPRTLDIKAALNALGWHYPLLEAAERSGFHPMNHLDGSDEATYADQTKSEKVDPSVLEKSEMIRSLVLLQLDNKLDKGMPNSLIRYFRNSNSRTELWNILALIVAIITAIGGCQFFQKSDSKVEV